MAWVDGLAQVRWELVGLGAVDGYFWSLSWVRGGVGCWKWVDMWAVDRYFGGQWCVCGPCASRRRGSMVDMQLWIGPRLVDRRRRPGAGRLAKEVMLRAVIGDG